MRRFFLQPVYDLAAVLERLFAEGPHPARTIAVVIVAIAVTWFVYVPIHELLHVGACLATGGSVTELQVAPHYGGALLSRVFPFVTSGGDYAGRLSGFDTHGSDLVYLATDFGPFVISVFPGVWLLKLCARRRRAVLCGPAFVLGLAPLYNLIGDYYEMGSILTTRLAVLFTGPANRSSFESLRSDDVFKLVGQIWTHAEPIHQQWSGSTAAALSLVAVSFFVGVLLALATYNLGAAIATRVPKRPAPA